MNAASAEILSVALLVLILGFATVRPWGLPEAAVALPLAFLAIIGGTITWQQAWAKVTQVISVVVFLGAILLISQLCAEEGLFEACGAWMTRAASGNPRGLLTNVFVVSSVVTAILSLDATVVLLTPVVFVAAARSGVRPRPHVYACTHLSNSASLLLPSSNLTNLLALSASGLTFEHYAILMALPWILAILVEYIGFRIFFARDLNTGGPVPATTEAVAFPRFALTVVVCTLLGFVALPASGVSPAWAAVAGATVLSARALIQHRVSAVALVRSAGLSFLGFVIALTVVVGAVVDNGLDGTLKRIFPVGTSLVALLTIAGLAALLANSINNLPAILALIPVTAPLGAGAVLAALAGVNIGPNLTYAGSLATLLWRRIVQEHDIDVDLKEFTLLGLLTVPASLSLAVVGLWVSIKVFGG